MADGPVVVVPSPAATSPPCSPTSVPPASNFELTSSQRKQELDRWLKQHESISTDTKERLAHYHQVFPIQEKVYVVIIKNVRQQDLQTIIEVAGKLGDYGKFEYIPKSCQMSINYNYEHEANELCALLHWREILWKDEEGNAVPAILECYKKEIKRTGIAGGTLAKSKATPSPSRKTKEKPRKLDENSKKLKQLKLEVIDE